MREDISRGIASGWSIREIARRLDRVASTVGREVTRHGGRPSYRTHEADVSTRYVHPSEEAVFTALEKLGGHKIGHTMIDAGTETNCKKLLPS
jgi:hypothetical protein